LEILYEDDFIFYIEQYQEMLDGKSKGLKRRAVQRLAKTFLNKDSLRRKLS
jgi:hypothetical protein